MERDILLKAMEPLPYTMNSKPAIPQQDHHQLQHKRKKGKGSGAVGRASPGRTIHPIYAQTKRYIHQTSMPQEEVDRVAVAEAKAKAADSKLAPAVLAAREHTRMVAKWGAIDVPGLDQKRAEAIGLQPLVKQIGYATNTQELPSVLRDPGNSARFVRRTAELLLQASERWKQIEINCRDTNQYYKELLTTARVHEEAFRTAADILSKIMQRPGLLSVWELSCPGLLKSKTRELELQEEGTPVYLDTLKEKMRIDLIYDAVAHLKKIEDERPIRVSDIEVKQAAVALLAKAEQDKILLQESQLAQELKEIGDGSETILKFDKLLQDSLPTNVLQLRQQQLLSCPAQIFDMTHLEVLDLTHNAIPELPAAVCQLMQLKKLYLDDNRLRTLPGELHKLASTLTMLGCANNPLEENLMQIYLSGLPALMAHLKSLRRAQRTWKATGTVHGPTGAGGASRVGDLYTTRLPDYSHETQPLPPPRPPPRGGHPPPPATKKL